MEGGHSAGAAIHGLGGEIEILAGVSGIQGDNAMGGLEITPLHAVRNRAPDQNQGRPDHEGLHERGFVQPGREVRPGLPLPDQGMVQGQIAVQTARQAVTIPCHDIGLQRVPAPGRRHRPEHGRGAALSANALHRPEQKAQFIHGNGLLPPGPVALAPGHGPDQVHAPGKIRAGRGRQVNALLILPRRLLHRRRRHPTILIRKRKINAQAQVILEKGTHGLHVGNSFRHVASSGVRIVAPSWDRIRRR